MYICICKNIKEKEIINILENNKIKNLRELQKYIEIANQCKVCRKEVSKIIKDKK